MIPLLIFAYNSQYLESILIWLQDERFSEKYYIVIWDNGGSHEICNKYDFPCYYKIDEQSGLVKNCGKAYGAHRLMKIINKEIPNADVYVCMDADVIITRDHLDAVVSAAQNPEIGMIGPRWHPFHSPVPSCGTIKIMNTPASTKNEPIRVFPVEKRLKEGRGFVAGTLFAISKETVEKLPCCPDMYPILVDERAKQFVVYWNEDAWLDIELTKYSLINGYLERSDLIPAIHLPELDMEYQKWKVNMCDGANQALDGYYDNK